MSIQNLEAMWLLTDRTDLAEGMQAYQRYHMLLARVADKFGFSLDSTVAAFVSLSPNNNYQSNVRSLISLLDGINKGVPKHEITVSTYNHCRDRAYDFATGLTRFEDEVDGPKIRSFYDNILRPTEWGRVTVDGHIANIWRGTNNSMKGAIVKSRTEYNCIADDVKRLAFAKFLLPHQAQATLWFTRKRVCRILYQPQGDLFGSPDDLWRTLLDIDDIKPYPTRKQKDKAIKHLKPPAMALFDESDSALVVDIATKNP